jgi:hypothetical protein
MILPTILHHGRQRFGLVQYFIEDIVEACKKCDRHLWKLSIFKVAAACIDQGHACQYFNRAYYFLQFALP